MKISTVILVAAAGVLAWIALTAPQQARPARAAGLPVEAPVPEQLRAEIPAGYVARVFDVEGMCCTGCPRGLYEQVLEVEGVVAAAASFDAGTISAVVPADFAVSELTGVLNSGKYRATLRE